MKKLSLLLLLTLTVAACHRGNDDVVINDGFYEYETNEQVVVYPTQPSVPAATRIGANLDRDIVVETDHHVIQMVGNPGTQYKYYVWTGDQNTDSDPDVIVDRGTVMVRTDE